MTGSILQLVAYGIENIFLNHKPQITYFKVVYKRHTNFSREEIRQDFIQRLDFGKRSTCTVSKNGDLMEKTYLVITLPEIPKFKTQTGDDDITKVEWVRKIGYMAINKIEVEINGRVLSRHFGEYMLLKNELFGCQDENYKKVIGDIEELTEYTNGKKEYKLYIPLQFWFCRSSCNSIPLITLTHSDIKINVELNKWEDLLKITPTHYIQCSEIGVEFADNEIIYQTVNNITSYGEFLTFDPYDFKLYYRLLTSTNFESIPENTSNTNNYYIKGLTTNAKVLPITKSSTNPVLNPRTYTFDKDKLNNLTLGDSYFLINYYYLDDDERMRFIKTRHDYLIEQVYYSEYNEITGTTEQLKLNIDNPCKALYWVLQQKYLYDSKDYLNYTNSPQKKLKEDTKYNNINIGDPIGNKLSRKGTILLNQRERLSNRDTSYFTQDVIYNNCAGLPPRGTHIFFFGLYPNSITPSGSCNMSKIERSEIRLTVDPILSANNIGIFRCYAESYNLFRASFGLGAVLFDR